MSLTQLLIVLRARWASALMVLIAVGAIAVVVNLFLPKRYAASASVVLDVKSMDPIAGVVLPGMNASGYMATQADVIQSQRVAIRALQSLKLDEKPEIRRKWQESAGTESDFIAWLADVIIKDLDVKPSRESNVLTITYTSADPKLAAQLANAFVSAYVSTTLDLRVEPAKQYSSFFDERSKASRDALEEAQSRLSAYQQKNGIMATEERLDVESTRLNELSSQLVALQAVADESTGRQNQIGSNVNQLSEVLNNPLIAMLKGDLARQESRLTELVSRLGEQNPQVIELRATLTQMRERIESETRRVAGGISVNNSVNQGRLAQLRAALEEQRAKMLRLKGQRDEVAVLQRDVQNAQRAYDAVSTRMSQTSMESQTTQTNVSVLKNATPPLAPSTPRTSLNLAIALVLGSLLAVGTAILRESLDQRLRTEDDVIVLLKQPLIGVLPARMPGASKKTLLKLPFADGGLRALPRFAK